MSKKLNSSNAAPDSARVLVTGPSCSGKSTIVQAIRVYNDLHSVQQQALFIPPSRRKLFAFDADIFGSRREAESSTRPTGHDRPYPAGAWTIPDSVPAAMSAIYADSAVLLAGTGSNTVEVGRAAADAGFALWFIAPDTDWLRANLWRRIHDMEEAALGLEGAALRAANNRIQRERDKIATLRLVFADNAPFSVPLDVVESGLFRFGNFETVAQAICLAFGLSPTVWARALQTSVEMGTPRLSITGRASARPTAAVYSCVTKRDVERALHEVARVTAAPHDATILSGVSPRGTLLAVEEIIGLHAVRGSEMFAVRPEVDPALTLARLRAMRARDPSISVIGALSMITLLRDSAFLAEVTLEAAPSARNN